ncbi:calcium-independent phospholipase [Fusarium tjaetaba]|uniref:Calcium-independent phospholipase n=1 Tax=Fusarium tjaetaba TaxID=1567544 RepID=A0A8H5SB22_9HYPO|nr:calcium-independent phospholipase [Fusarium tjaetaba]KAF5647835.1 calcium-independent phospholipase [Fusarium tjaetaba]
MAQSIEAQNSDNKPDINVTDNYDVDVGRVENVESFSKSPDAVDDNILLAQGHAPVMRRSFDLLGTLGLGFSITNSWVSNASCFGQSLLYGGAQILIPRVESFLTSLKGDTKATMADLDPALYTIAWIAPLEIEAQAALHMLDHKHEGRFPTSRGDDYVFEAGDINGHNIIIATLPIGQEYGTGSAAAIASQIKKFFPNLWFGLLVGVAAGLPNHQKDPPIDIRLGDVLVGLSTPESAGLIAYDLGKETADGFQLLNDRRVLAPVETVVRSAIGSIKMSLNDTEAFLPFYESIKNKHHSSGTFIDPGQEEDVLYYTESSAGARKVMQRKQRPSSNRTRVWYGSIGSGEKLTKNSQKRDHLRDTYNLIGLEMEAAGIMNRVPVGVIRGVCDYADENKNKKWQPFAAAMAAAYAKAVLLRIGSGQAAPKSMALQTGMILCDLPTRTDRFFGREDELLKIENSLEHTSDSLKSVILCGISGSGKTQLAREYVARKANNFSAILWIDASTELTAEQSWNSCASYIQRKVPGLKVQDSYTSLRSFVMEWLRTTAAKDWLVIIDRADAPMATKRLLDPFNTLNHGSLCITTTHQAIARAMRTKQILIERLDPVSSQNLILWRAFESQEEHSSQVLDSVVRTAKALDGFPLALELAGILIYEGIVPLKTFAETFASKYNQLARFNVDPGIWLWNRSDSLFEMFDELYHSLVAKSPNAGLLLTLCAVYGPWNLPISLIQGLQIYTDDERSDNPTCWGQLKSLLNDDVELNLAIYEICRVFLAKRQMSADGNILSITLHGSVCQWRFATIGEQRAEWIMKTSFGLAWHRESVKQSSETMAEEGSQIDANRGFLHLFDKCLNSIENHVPSEDLEPATGKFARHYYTFCSCSAPLYLSSGNSAKAKELFSVAINYARSSESRVGDLDAAKEALESALEIAEGICGYRSEQTLEIVAQLKTVSEGIAMEQDHRQRAAVASTGSKLNEVQSNAEQSSSSSLQPPKRSSRVANFLLRPLGLRIDPQNVEGRGEPEYQIVDPVPVPQYIPQSPDLLGNWIAQDQHNSYRHTLRSRDELASQAPEVVSNEIGYIPLTGFTIDEPMKSVNPGLALEICLLNPAVFIPAASGVAPGVRGTLRLRVKDRVQVEAITLTLRAVQRANWLPPDIPPTRSEQFQEELEVQSTALFQTTESRQGAPYGSDCQYLVSSSAPSSKASTQAEPANSKSFPGGLYCYPFQFTLANDRLPTARLGHGSLTWLLKATLTFYETSGSSHDIELVKEVPVIRNRTFNQEAITRWGLCSGRITFPYRIWIKHSQFFFGDKIPVLIAFGPSITSARMLKFKCSIIQTEEYWTPDGRNTCTVPPREIAIFERVSNLSEGSDLVTYKPVGPKPGPLSILYDDVYLPTCKGMDQNEKYHLRASCTLRGMQITHHLRVSHTYITELEMQFIDMVWQITIGVSISDPSQTDIETVRDHPITLLDCRSGCKYYNPFSYKRLCPYCGTVDWCFEEDIKVTVQGINDRSRERSLLVIIRFATKIRTVTVSLRHITAGSAAQAVRWATDCGVDIISISWTIETPVPGNPEMESLQQAVRRASNHNIVMFCSTSDQGSMTNDHNCYPGDFGGCIRIGSASNTGDAMAWVKVEKVDFLLPGSNVPFSVTEGKTNLHESGSSIATAAASGLAAFLMACSWLLDEKDNYFKDYNNMKRAFHNLAQGHKFPAVSERLEKLFMRKLERIQGKDEKTVSELPMEWSDECQRALGEIINGIKDTT